LRERLQARRGDASEATASAHAGLSAEPLTGEEILCPSGIQPLKSSERGMVTTSPSSPPRRLRHGAILGFIMGAAEMPALVVPALAF
jgi:hypothetical protein